MGIYIPNMEKPKSCAECPFEVIDTSGYTRCVIMQQMVVDGNLFNRCPLEEVDLVRCGECKWWDSDDGNVGYCHAEKHCYRSSNWEIDIYRRYKKDHSCSDGERRNDE